MQAERLLRDIVWSDDGTLVNRVPARETCGRSTGCGVIVKAGQWRKGLDPSVFRLLTELGDNTRGNLRRSGVSLFGL